MIYKTFRASNGVTVQLDDRYFARETQEELARRRAELQRVVDEICYKAAVRAAQQKEEK